MGPIEEAQVQTHGARDPRAPLVHKVRGAGTRKSPPLMYNPRGMTEAGGSGSGSGSGAAAGGFAVTRAKAATGPAEVDVKDVPAYPAKE
jgi:hypothetical protein